MLQQIALGGIMIALPIYLQMVLEYNALEAGLSLAPLSLTMFGVAVLAGRRAGGRRPSAIIRAGFLLFTLGVLVLLPIVPRADSGWWLLVPLVIAGSGLGLLVSQLNNYTLAPITEERVSEAAGVNSAAGSFGLSFGLAFAGAILLATLSITFTDMAQASSVLAPAEQERVADALEDDAQVLSNTQLSSSSPASLAAVQDEIVRINTDARPLALQVALLVPLLAGLVGLFNAFRMLRMPDPEPSGSVEGMAWLTRAGRWSPPASATSSSGTTSPSTAPSPRSWPAPTSRSADTQAGLLAAFAVFSTAFIVRPVGALLLGRLGDRRGRRQVLATAIILMSVATAGVGVLPGYRSIGLLAPVLLVLLRVAQGLSAGGRPARPRRSWSSTRRPGGAAGTAGGCGRPSPSAWARASARPPR